MTRSNLLQHRYDSFSSFLFFFPRQAQHSPGPRASHRKALSWATTPASNRKHTARHQHQRQTRKNISMHKVMRSCFSAGRGRDLLPGQRRVVPLPAGAPRLRARVRQTGRARSGSFPASATVYVSVLASITVFMHDYFDACSIRTCIIYSKCICAIFTASVAVRICIIYTKAALASG